MAKALFYLTPDLLKRILDLPWDYEVSMVTFDLHHRQIQVQVESPSLQREDVDDTLPLELTGIRYQWREDEGHTWVTRTGSIEVQ